MEVTMSYGAFLLNEILSLKNEEYANSEYDIKFANAVKYYEMFLNSEFNTNKFSEYDCIYNFIESASDFAPYKGLNQNQTYSIIDDLNRVIDVNVLENKNAYEIVFVSESGKKYLRSIYDVYFHLPVEVLDRIITSLKSNEKHKNNNVLESELYKIYQANLDNLFKVIP